MKTKEHFCCKGWGWTVFPEVCWPHKCHLLLVSLTPTGESMVISGSPQPGAKGKLVGCPPATWVGNLWGSLPFLLWFIFFPTFFFCPLTILNCFLLCWWLSPQVTVALFSCRHFWAQRKGLLITKKVFLGVHPDTPGALCTRLTIELSKCLRVARTPAKPVLQARNLFFASYLLFLFYDHYSILYLFESLILFTLKLFEDGINNLDFLWCKLFQVTKWVWLSLREIISWSVSRQSVLLTSYVRETCPRVDGAPLSLGTSSLVCSSCHFCVCGGMDGSQGVFDPWSCKEVQFHHLSTDTIVLLGLWGFS